MPPSGCLLLETSEEESIIMCFLDEDFDSCRPGNPRLLLSTGCDSPLSLSGADESSDLCEHSGHLHFSSSCVQSTAANALFGTSRVTV